MGKGSRVRFWEDRWCLDEPLCVRYPDLFVLSRKQQCFICDIVEVVDNGVQWNLDFQRRFTDSEIVSMTRLLSILDNFRVSVLEDSV